MKRTLAVLVVLLMACTLLFAAGQQEEEVNADSGKIVLYSPSWGIEFAEEMIAEYAKVKPGVEIELMRGPSAWNEHVGRTSLWMKTKFSGVDLVYMDDSGIVDGVPNGYWEKLDDVLAPGSIENLVGLQQKYIDAHGGLYRVPWWNGMGYLFYRIDMFEEAGIEVPTTWDELMVAAEKLTIDKDNDGTIDQWGYLTQGGPGEMYNNWTEFLMQAGGDQFKYAENGKATDEALNALLFMKELYNTVTPPDMVAIDYNQSRAMFTQGKAAILRDWADTGRLAVTEGMTDKIGVMEFPAGPAGSWGVGHSWGIAVNKFGDNYKKNPQAIVDFLNFMMTDEIHSISAKAEGPALASIMDDPAKLDKIIQGSIVIEHFSDFINHRDVRNFPAGNSAEYMDIIGKNISAFVFDRDADLADANDVLVTIQEGLDPLF